MATVSSSGASIVWNNDDSKVKSKYDSDGITFTSTDSTNVPVYINLKNPSSNTPKLSKIRGQITTNKATIDKVVVYFGATKIYGSASGLGYDRKFSFSVDQAGSQNDDEAAGICVTLTLKFTDAATIKISSLGVDFA